MDSQRPMQITYMKMTKNKWQQFLPSAAQQSQLAIIGVEGEHFL